MSIRTLSRVFGIASFVVPASLVVLAACGGSSDSGGGGGDDAGGSSTSSSGSSGTSTSSSSSSSSSSGGTDGGGDANGNRCKLMTVTGSQTVNATFKSLKDEQPPTMTGGTLGGAYKITAAVVYLPELADAKTAKGTVNGWARFEKDEFKMLVDADVTVDTIIGAQMVKQKLDSAGTFTTAGAKLNVDPKVCDPAYQDDGNEYSFTDMGTGTAQLLVKFRVQNVADAYILVTAAK